MAKASTEKKSKTSLEPSEIFCAVGLHMTTQQMKNLCTGKDSQNGTKLLKWASDDGWKIASNAQNIDMAGNDTKFKKFFKDDAAKYEVAGNPGYSSTDKDKRKQLVGAIVAGFSAAMGIQDFMKSMGDSGKVSKVYLTGATWPKEVNDFRLKNEDSGFDYNSSDMVCKVNSQTFYGISLKKKTNAKGADPTMINKAYSTFIKSSKFDTAREKLFDERKKYFAQKVRDAHKDGIINMPELETGRGKNDDDWIWNYNFRKSDGTNVALINLKGSNDDDKPVMLSDVEGSVAGKELLNKPKGKMGLKEYINDDLAKPDNKLFGEFRNVIDANGELFAESLIDIVLKTKMQSRLSAKKIGKMFFEFALVTGYADYSQRKDPNQDKLTLNAAKVIPQHSILCGLSNLAGNKKNYEVVYDTKQKLETNAAKVFYDLNRDGTTILNLQLRYKGNFKQQPQFFATLADGFVKQMHEECVVTR